MSVINNLVSRPQVLLLHKDESDDPLDDFDTDFPYTVNKATSLTTEHLTHSEAIIVIDKDFSRKKQKNIQIRLSEYAKAGGKVILAYASISIVVDPDFASRCRNMERPWRWGGYNHTAFALNPAFAPIFGNEAFKTLEQSYSMEAMQLTNVHAAAKVYIPSDGPSAKWAVFRLDKVDEAETPATWQKHGQGHIGYIGDVKNESGSQALIMAMLSSATKEGSHQGVADERADLPALVPGCEVCNKDTPVKKCGACMSVQYCSFDCQEADGESHKAQCQRRGS